MSFPTTIDYIIIIVLLLLEQDVVRLHIVGTHHCERAYETCVSITKAIGEREQKNVLATKQPQRKHDDGC
jgi:hypothetical protein